MDAPSLVKRARQQSGLTQRALADRAGVTRQTVALVESGARCPSLRTLVGLLAAAGVQMHVELEPLDADVRRAIEDRRAAADATAEVVAIWVDLPPMDDVAYRVEGLAAAALLGAPVPVPAVRIELADTDATYDWLAAQLRDGRFRVHVDGWWGALDFALSPRPWRGGDSNGGDGDNLRGGDGGGSSGDGRSGGGRSGGGDGDGGRDGDGAVVRARLAEVCPDGRFRLEVLFEEVEARFAPADEVARCVRVETSAGTIRVQPLDEIEPGDPAVARVLRVMRHDAITRE